MSGLKGNVVLETGGNIKNVIQPQISYRAIPQTPQTADFRIVDHRFSYFFAVCPHQKVTQAIAGRREYFGFYP